MNEKKEENNLISQNINILNPLNEKNQNQNNKLEKSKRPSYLNSSNCILKKDNIDTFLYNRNYSYLNQKKPLNLLKNLDLLNNEDQNNEILLNDITEENNNSQSKEKEIYNKVNTQKTSSTKYYFQEFYINDNKKNQNLKYKNNSINTTKYNIITFIPKSLLIQFAKLPNVYFLATAIIQSIPLISPLSSITAIFPLIFVLSVSMIRDLIEDLSRLTYDRLNNNEEIIVYRDGKFTKSISSSLNIGELIIINENKQIPTDIILIDSNLNEGMAYVETSSLDGEKNLKPKIANNNLCGLFNNLLNNNDENPFNSQIFNNMYFEGFCQCDPPNSNLHKLDGRVSINYNINNTYIHSIKFPISERQMLLKGSVLKNTNWIIGFVLYTGMNNKIILNSKRPRNKMSIIEKKMNKYLIGIFILLIFICGFCSIFHNEKYHQKRLYYEKFILLQRSHKLESFITFFTYFLLLNTLIPISLIITMEIVKVIQGFFISWDIEMYSQIRHKFAKAKSVSINEELGNVNYIFTDKTGTLTANKLKFKYCIIYGKCYEYDKYSKENSNKIINEIFYKNEINIKKKKFPIVKIPRKFFTELLKLQKKEDELKELEKNNIKINEEELEIINEFWTGISIAHECVCTKICKYSGVSPDDVELVKTAHEQGYSFLQSSNEIREIRIDHSIHTFSVLHVLNFSSERKRMSIIIKDNNNIIKLYCKGADCEIIKRMSKSSKNNIYSNFTIKSVDKLSCQGYRSLLIAYKIILEDEYNKWNLELKNSEMNLAKKAKLIDKLYDEMEQNLILIGATIVEDKLQDEVPETIKDLRMAGIKIWVLTGDKIDTAENISLSCNLITPKQKLFKVYVSEGETERSKYDVTPEIRKFFREYNDFIKECNITSLVYSNTINFKKTNNININSNNINHKSKSILNNFPKNPTNNQNNNSNNEGSALSFIPSINGSIINNNSNQKTISKKKTYLLKHNNNKNNSNLNNSSSISSKNSLSNYISITKDMEKNPFSIIIESNILSSILSNDKRKNLFLSIALKASTVICCRVSPLQKSRVIKEVKQYDPKAITLAIGDGGNDVSMIMEAHLGIGIYGEEGMRAVQASDFSIGEFKFLRRLLFFHGRMNNIRISKMILYFFYKNFVFSIVQFVYSFFCIGSGQTIIDDWFITLYNLVFTALPLGVQAISDFDVLEKDNNIVFKFMPLLYKESREIYPVFNIITFVFSLTKGFITSFLIFYIVCFSDLGSEINRRGDYGTLWYMSFKTYTSIIISVNMTLFLSVRYIIFLFPLIMMMTSFIFYFIFLVIVNYLTMFNSCAVVFHSLSCPKIYFSIFLVSSMSFLTDYMIESIKMNFNNSLSTHLLRKILNKNYDSSFMDNLIENRNQSSGIFQFNKNKNKTLSKLSIFSSNISDNYIEIDNTFENTIMKKSKTSKINIEKRLTSNSIIYGKNNNNSFSNNNKLILDVNNNKKIEIPEINF